MINDILGELVPNMDIEPIDPGLAVVVNAQPKLARLVRRQAPSNQGEPPN